jgi:hypothetical protein
LAAARFGLWEGPFADPNQRLPQAPDVAAERRATMRAWRGRQRIRKARQRPEALAPLG